MNRGDFRRIARLVKDIRDAIAAAGDATSKAVREYAATKQRQAESKPTTYPERISVEVNLPQAEVDRYYTDQGKTYRLHRRTFWTTFLTFVAVVAYAIITWFQWRTMDRTFQEVKKQTTFAQATAQSANESASTAQQALKQARDQFRQDQQPIVWVSQEQNKSFNALISIGQPIKMSLWYENYGRSAAVIIAYSADTEIGLENIRRLHHGVWRNAESVLPVGKADEFNFPSKDIVTPENIGLISVPGGIAFLVGILYHDLGGHVYESDFCFFTGADRVLHGCPSSFHLNRILDCEKDKCGR
jgi:hypothetical protein